MPFLTEKEALGLQNSNKFFYNIAVSRVQLKLCLPIWHYFIQRGFDQFKHNIFRVNSLTTELKCITNTSIDFKYCSGSVSIANDLYCYFENGSFSKISNINSLAVAKTSLDTPSHHGNWPALAGYKNSHIFLTGGHDTRGKLSRVSVYSVARDEWSLCTNLNRARNHHSSCVLGDKLYVSGGLEIDSIEVADCSNLIQEKDEWSW